VPFEVSQVAMIVRDLDASMAVYQKTHGWGPWDVYEYRPPRLRDLQMRGVPVDCSWQGAETMVGGVGIELLQPLSPNGVFAEWLDTHGEGVHHIGYWAPTMDQADAIRAALAATGAEELVSAWIDDVYFFYMDTRPVVCEVWTGDMASVRASRRYP